MTTKDHSVIIVPGQTLHVVCKDGMSSVETETIQKFFNFGGKVTFQNCGAENQFAALKIAEKEMLERWLNASST